MTEVLSALIPPLVMAGFFIALVITAMRATDWGPGASASGPRKSTRPSGPGGAGPQPPADSQAGSQDPTP